MIEEGALETRALVEGWGVELIGWLGLGLVLVCQELLELVALVHIELELL
jgi:hypothetical protein